jgi:hypothetical protein
LKCDALFVISGTLAIEAGATSTLVFNFGGSTVLWSDGFWSENRRWLVFDNLVAPQLTSADIFDTISVSLDSGGNALGTVRPDGGFSWNRDGDDVYLVYAVVPEPTAAVIAGAGLAAAALIPRRRRGKPGATPHFPPAGEPGGGARRPQ